MTKFIYQKTDAVRVRWVGSNTHDGWHDPDLQSYCSMPITSYGFIIEDKDDNITLAPTISEHGMVCSTITIPRVCIEDISPLFEEVENPQWDSEELPDDEIVYATPPMQINRIQINSDPNAKAQMQMPAGISPRESGQPNPQPITGHAVLKMMEEMARKMRVHHVGLDTSNGLSETIITRVSLGEDGKLQFEQINPADFYSPDDAGSVACRLGVLAR